MSMSMGHIPNVLYVSLLHKYAEDQSHVLKTKKLELTKNLIFEECLIKILDRKVKVLQNKQIPLVKVLWRNQKVKRLPPRAIPIEFRGQNLNKEGRNVTPLSMLHRH